MTAIYSRSCIYFEYMLFVSQNALQYLRRPPTLVRASPFFVFLHLSRLGPFDIPSSHHLILDLSLADTSDVY